MSSELNGKQNTKKPAPGTSPRLSRRYPRGSISQEQLARDLERFHGGYEFVVECSVPVAKFAGLSAVSFEEAVKWVPALAAHFDVYIRAMKRSDDRDEDAAPASPAPRPPGDGPPPMTKGRANQWLTLRSPEARRAQTAKARAANRILRQDPDFRAAVNRKIGAGVRVTRQLGE